MNNNLNPLIIDIIESGLDHAPEFISGLAKLAGKPEFSLIVTTILIIALGYVLQRANKIIDGFVKPILTQQYGIKFPKKTSEKISDWGKRQKEKIKNWWDKLKKKRKRK